MLSQTLESVSRALNTEVAAKEAMHSIGMHYTSRSATTILV